LLLSNIRHSANACHGDDDDNDDAGDSWAKTGKKRRHSQRYSALDRRIDFLKQILRDMLDERGIFIHSLCYLTLVDMQ